MREQLKTRFYLLLARYFCFWARIALKRWQPRVIVIIGSAGKTTMLHMLEAQLGDMAHYSHHANSPYGIAYDILELPGVTKSSLDWLKLYLLAPIQAFRAFHREDWFVVELDIVRPKVASLMARVLQPDACIWVSSLKAHTSQYDHVVGEGKQFASHEEAIAYEHGTFLASTKDLVIINGDSEDMQSQVERVSAAVVTVDQKNMRYRLLKDRTEFYYKDQAISIDEILPESNSYQVSMVAELLKHYNQPLDASYKEFKLPPGRSSIFKGIRDITIFDSTYNNSNLTSLVGILELFVRYPGIHKWAVVGDMLEQGSLESATHKEMATHLSKCRFDRLILVGPRTAKHTLPHLSPQFLERTNVQSFSDPADVFAYLDAELKGGEVVLFKGIRYLEGVIERLLQRPSDAAKLARRGKLWDKRRKEWGL